MSRLTLTRPDDWHLHVRDGAALAAVVPDTARRFGRALIMPNLKPPVTSVAQAAAYRERILAAVPAGLKFAPLMTLYLTDTLPPDEIDRAAASGFIPAAKLYPAVKEFGAFVEFLPKKEGLLHISEISWKRLETMNGVFKEGDKVKVKLLDIDPKNGKFKLSRKVLLPKPEAQPKP